MHSVTTLTLFFPPINPFFPCNDLGDFYWRVCFCKCLLDISLPIKKKNIIVNPKETCCIPPTPPLQKNWVIMLVRVTKIPICPPPPQKTLENWLTPLQMSVSILSLGKLIAGLDPDTVVQCWCPALICCLYPYLHPSIYLWVNPNLLERCYSCSWNNPWCVDVI